MYYLRSRSAVDAVKVTVSSEKAAKDAYINTLLNKTMNQKIAKLAVHKEGVLK